MIGSQWEIVIPADGARSGVERLRVPGGWLYRTETETRIVHAEHGHGDDWQCSWSIPVFVPDGVL